MNQFAVHQVRLFKPPTQAIHCMVFDTYSNRLAVSRSDGHVELYRFNENGVIFTYEFSLPLYLLKEDPPLSVEALAFWKGRLFSAGLAGCVIEYDLERLGIARSLQIDSGSVWALSTALSSQTGGGLLACGCDSGNVYLLDLVDCSGDNTLDLHGPPLHQNHGRVLSLCWLSQGKYLIAGCIGCITIWKRSSSRGKVLWQLTLPEKVVVWSLVAYPSKDHIFASSDSRGIVSIWNARNGTLISELSTHHLEVLTLTVGAVHNQMPMIFAAGSDPTVIAVFPTLSDNLTAVDSWMTAEIHKEHEHDVRSSAFVPPNFLLTAGIDRSIVIAKINSVHVKRVFNRTTFVARMLPMLSWRSYVSAESISSAQIILAISQPSTEGCHTVDVWQLLGSSKDYELEEDSKKCDPYKELVVKLSCRLPPHIVKLAPLANFIALATGNMLRIFKLDIAAPSASKHFASTFEPLKAKYPAPMITDVAFANEPSKTPVLALAADGQLLVQSLWRPEVKSNFRLNKDFCVSSSDNQSNALPVVFLRICKEAEENGDSFVVAVGSKNLIWLYRFIISENDEEPFSLQKLCRLPDYSNGLITAFSIYPKLLVLVAFSDRRLAEFDGKAQRFTKWTRQTLVGASANNAKRRKLLKTENTSNTEDAEETIEAYPKTWLALQETIDWVGYASSSKSKILTVSNKLIATIDTTKSLPVTIEGPLFKTQVRRGNVSPDPNATIHHSSRFRYIVAFDCLKGFNDTVNDDESLAEDCLAPGELFVAEFPSGEFKALLPPVVVCKKQFSV